jgi:hypothetical protein
VLVPLGLVAMQIAFEAIQRPTVEISAARIPPTLDPYPSTL